MRYDVFLRAISAPKYMDHLVFRPQGTGVPCKGVYHTQDTSRLRTARVKQDRIDGMSLEKQGKAGNWRSCEVARETVERQIRS